MELEQKQKNSDDCKPDGLRKQKAVFLGCFRESPYTRREQTTTMWKLHSDCYTDIFVL